MSDALPTPPASPSRQTSTTPKPGFSLGDLEQELDTLLERYLNLLDEQQNLQNELGKYMSSGFLSLARANQSCPPGRWYGRDYYDERMKAVRRIEINPSEIEATTDKRQEGKDEKCADDEKPQFETESHPIRSLSFKTLVESTPTESSAPDRLASGVETSDKGSDTDVEPKSADEKPKTGNSTPTSTKTPTSASTNPLRWFGVLVPPSLRAAQGSFTSAVEGPVPALVGVIAEMREVEVKVNKLRGLLAAGKDEVIA